MKERPILFKPEMVRAILDGKKTQTRRTSGLDAINEDPNRWELEGRVLCSVDRRDVGKYAFVERDGDESAYVKCHYGEVGDRLWVKEQFRQAYQETVHSKGFVYRADKKASLGMDEYSDRHKWRPSIHMPRWACRLVLEITDVRVERVQDITEEDAIAEGVSMEAGETDMRWNPVQAFQNLWDSIHNKDGYDWDKNPWLWVITFRRTEQVGDG